MLGQFRKALSISHLKLAFSASSFSGNIRLFLAGREGSGFLLAGAFLGVQLFLDTALDDNALLAHSSFRFSSIVGF